MNTTLATKNNAWTIILNGRQLPAAWCFQEVIELRRTHGEDAIKASRYLPMYDARTKAALGLIS